MVSNHLMLQMLISLGAVWISSVIIRLKRVLPANGEFEHGCAFTRKTCSRYIDQDCRLIIAE